MKRLLNFHLLAAMLLILFLPSMAAGATQRAMILPFAINGPQGYKYLEKSIPQMFATRLYWPEHIEALLPESEKLNTVPEGESRVRAIIKENNLDYAVWGSVTVIGEECSLDVRVLDKGGKLWTKSRENRVDQLIPVLSSVSDSINAEVFGRTSQTAQSAAAPKATVVAAPVTTQTIAAATAPDTRGLVVVAAPDKSAQGGGLNMVENTNDDRFVSQQLNLSAVGMSVCDADGDGRNEIFLFDDNHLYAYHYENGRIVAINKTLISRILYNINLTSFDFGPGVGRKLVLSTVDLDNEPRSFIIGYKDRKLATEITTSKYYLNVIKDADGKEKLVGQLSDTYDMFRYKSSVEMKLVNGKLVEAAPFVLPDILNVYNFAYLPGKKGTNEATRIVRISGLEKLQTYSLGGVKQFESSDDYSAGQAGIQINPTMLGSGEDAVQDREYYYIPHHMPVYDLDGDGRYEVIVNKPITFAGKFFSRYRAFVESEVSAMYWDGIGLTPQWKTPILAGSVAGVAVADLDGNGVLDLIICLNAANSNIVAQQKATIVAFPLHFSKASALK